MRVVVILALVASPVFVATLTPSSRPEQSGQVVTTATDTGLILQKGEGKRRVRRPRLGSTSRLAAAAMIIKVDQKNGGSPDFFMGSEDILPGDAIAPHLHPEYDEILFVHRTAKADPNDIDMILLMEDTFDLASVTGEAALVFQHLETHARFGASVFWTRRSGAIGGERAMIDYWQVRRQGGQRGIVEILPEGT